ncbi:MAG: dual specificity protein phosphatase family protein [Nitrososphaerota archaeon]|nr:dual specificity protein phosphatase family protein [Nitrososphaerota archaeon]MDG6928155.1 dual specificity protein phosphatase family protein [Nitrososphaerota archaeon]MDG6930073.1 dual specificity protein phosphatase family protein [Nitrososphaerota archaeon]MDG6932818.1 dual specificity protein phosphatase family protein [Nitrososphaerota archaeon]MDG6935502.1 dual specificity protein phosphatase family protein [Nitrososphaerota archaeon]
MLRLSDYYRFFLSLILGRPSNFSVIDSCLYASGIPAGSKAIKWLKKMGVDAVISLTEHPINKSNEFNVYYNIPMVNGAPADPQALEKVVLKISDLINNRHCVLVHCSAGLGRTGMVIASYLVYAKRVNPEEAIEKVKGIRPGSLRDADQIKSVYKFAEWIKPKVAESHK